MDKLLKRDLEGMGFTFYPPVGFDLARAVSLTAKTGELAESLTSEASDRVTMARVARWQRLVDELGDREEVIRCLEFVDTPQAQLMLAAFAHPEYLERPVAFIAVGAHVTEAQFKAMMASGLAVKNRYEAARATAPKIHGVVSDLGEDASARWIKCPDCKGKGSTKDSEICPTCDSAGKVRLAAPVKKQELFLKQAGLIQEGGNVTVNTAVTVQQAAASLPSLEEVVGTSNVVSIRSERLD